MVVDGGSEGLGRMEMEGSSKEMERSRMKTRERKGEIVKEE